MSIPGPTVHRQLIAAYTDAQTRLETARRDILLARDRRQSLDGDRGEVLEDLAEHYLPELSRDAVSRTWNDVRQAVELILLRMEDRQRQLREAISLTDTRIATADQALVDVNEEIDAAMRHQDQVAHEVERRLQADPEFVRLTDRAAIAEATLERAEANLREIEQDSARKLPAYDASSLFRYLQDRGYGTDRYSSRGLTRRVDRWLSRLINFPIARQSYDFLKQTPVQMRKIIADDRAALDTVMGELERRRDQVADQLGLPQRIAATESLVAKRDQQLRSLDALRIELQESQSQLTALDDRGGPFYREAIEVFRTTLDRVDPNELRRRAAQTHEVTDDQIVARLLGIETQIDHLDGDTTKRRSELDRMQSFLEGIGRLIQQFRAARYDTAQSQFIGSFDLAYELSQSRDPSELEDIWSRLRRAHRQGPTVMDQVTQIATHPMTQVLVNAMAHAAAGALQQQARNAGSRRSSGSPSWPSGPSRSSAPRGGGGFHNRGSF